MEYMDFGVGLSISFYDWSKHEYFIGTDLRDCLVEREGSIRIADLAMACEQYRDDYCHTASGDLAPLRWWSWESVLTVSSL